MTIERAQEFQERMMREAAAMLNILGDAMDAEKWEQAIALIGKAWCIPGEDTNRRLETLAAMRAYMRKEVDESPYPESELPMNATGMETLDNVWGLFETATQLSDGGERCVLFHIANELAECQNLLDWIETTPEEKELPQVIRT